MIDCNGRVSEFNYDSRHRVICEVWRDFVGGPILLVVNLVVFAGVGIAMMDIFGRVMERLDPARGRWPVC